MAVLFAINHCIYIHYVFVFPLLHGFNGNGNAVRHFIFKVHKNTLADKLCHYCSFGLVGKGIIGEIMRARFGIAVQNRNKNIYSVVLQCGNRHNLLKIKLF